ncbi:hypothetical protein G6F44_008014 [Rhizopus delemar]|nr:hypothetical protein G6F44_008014 [Rhizopus delemar]
MPFFRNSEGVSVGTKIKREAVRLFKQYYDLSCEENAVVGLGLNSILDITSSSAQKHLLINNWNDLRGLFGQRFKPGIKIDGKLERGISKIEEASKEDLEKGRFTCYRKEIDSKGEVHADIFSIYSQYLELMEFHSYVFDKTINATESDVVVKMWSPLIPMRESADMENRTTGLKVYLRFLKGTLSRRRKEADKANCEVSKMGAGHIKITSDRTKLLIESKAILDHLIKEELENVKEIAVPALQLIGNRATLYSINLAANALYVAVNEGTTVIPNHISHIKNFREVIMLLFKFKNATKNVMAFGLDGENSSSNSNNSNNSNNSPSWVRES